MIKRLVRLKPHPQQSALFRYFSGLQRADKAQTEAVVLVQSVEDTCYFGLFGQLVTSLREHRPIRAEQYVLRSLREGEGKSFFTFVVSRQLFNPLHNFKWTRLYSSFCDGVAYRNTSFHPIDDAIDAFRAWKCWRNLSDTDSLVSLQIDGLVVGDLINDSFLRYRPAPQVDLKDRYLPVLIWQTLRNIRRAKDYFSRVKPRLYLTSYCTYIQHGIPVRVALQCGVKVLSLGNLQEFTKELSLEDWVQTKNPDQYANDFNLLERQDEKIALANEALSIRLAGGVDSATAYMKKSAYAESGETVPDVRNAVVIFLHDFYDSPHIYREMVFPDFWEWVCFTIETLRSANIKCYIKPHPNQIDLSNEVLSKLKQRYPGLSLISSRITNKQLAEAGMSCAVTVYGTVAHEMAFLGVPSIACAHHPHISFDFCRTAYSRREYAEFLRGALQHKVDKDDMRRKSLIFYYMHNLNVDEETRLLRDAAIEYRLVSNNGDERQDVVELLKNMANLQGYRADVAGMLASESDLNV